VALTVAAAAATPPKPPRPILVPPLVTTNVDRGPVALGYSTTRDIVPDALTALAIARAILVPAYGAPVLADNEPLSAWRDGGTWMITGKRNCGKACLGGTLAVCLAAKDGRVLGVFEFFVPFPQKATSIQQCLAPR